MDEFITQVFILLTTPPGNLVYRVILAFSVFGTLQMFTRQEQGARNPVSRRMTNGLTGLLILQLLLFVAAGLGWQNLIDAHKILPGMVWGASLLSILLMIWLWAFPRPSRPADAATGLMFVLLLALTVFGILWWSEQSPLLFFNTSMADQVATMVGMGLSFLGCLILILRRPSLWVFGLASMLFLLAGCVLHWLYPPVESDYAGVLRLAEMAAYPLLLALPQRSVAEEKDTVQKGITPAQKTVQEPEQDDTSLLQTYLTLATESDSARFYEQVVRAYAKLMVADMCLIALPPEGDNQVVFPIGYDLIMDRMIEGFSISAHRVPLVANVLRRGRNVRLPANAASTDLTSLAEALSVKEVGHLMSVAITPKGSSPLLSIVLLSPYSNRLWTAQDQQQLLNEAAPLVVILQRAQVFASAQNTQQEAQVIRQENETLAERVIKLESQLEQERITGEKLKEGKPVGEARTTTEKKKIPVPSVSDDVTRLQGELNLALSELSRLKAELAATQQSSSQTPEQLPDSPVVIEKMEELGTISHELRRPVATISGHTDTLLGETLGPLTARQRKTLERVKAATERINGLLDEMIEVSSLEDNEAIQREVVDLNAVVDEALTTLIVHLSERHIALRVDLPDEMPQLNADREGILQVFTILLQNAARATPMDGEVWLRGRMEVKENEPGYILIQVTDSGPGIRPDELGRVFSRLYPSDEQPDTESAETETDLASVKSIVEAHNGRIWVDSEVGKGATFSVLLPLLENDPHPGGGFEA